MVVVLSSWLLLLSHGVVLFPESDIVEAIMSEVVMVWQNNQEEKKRKQRKIKQIDDHVLYTLHDYLSPTLRVHQCELNRQFQLHFCLFLLPLLVVRAESGCLV